MRADRSYGVWFGSPRGRAAGCVVAGVVLVGSVSLVGVMAAPAQAAVVPAAGGLAALSPVRVLDTRSGRGAVGPVGAYKTVSLVVRGVGGVPASGVAAVVLNVTVTQPKAAGYLTVYPDGVARPVTSNLNFSPGETIPNLVIAPVGADGRVDVYNGSGATVQVIADVSGWFASGTPGVGGLAALSPVRVLDTRSGRGAVGPVRAYKTVSLVVRGVGGVPASGVAAVVLNVTVTQPKAAGYLTVYPDGVARPVTSNLNFSPGETIPNLVIAPVRADGRVDVYNGSGATVQVIADVSGWFASGTPGVGGLAALSPVRVLDTRSGRGAVGPVGAYKTVSLVVRGVGGVPASGVAAVVLNVTVTQPKAAGYLTVYPDGVARPVTSNLNFSPGETIPNLVIAPVGADGRVDFYNGSGATVQVIADVSGWFASSTTQPISPAIGGDYSTIYGTAGEVTVHVSGNVYTVSVKTPFKIQGASCTLPAGTVIATFNGAGPDFAGGHSVFDPTTCAYQGAVSISVHLSPDGSLTLGSSTGFHLLTKTANASPVASPAVGGDYSTIYGTAGGVTVHVSGNVYTVSVKTPFKIQGASCTLPAGTVIATFNGAGPGFAGGHSVFDSTTCAYQGAVSVSVYLNNDDSITLGSSTGFHLLTKTANASPVASPAVGGDYSTIYGTAGGVTVHVSGNVYTVSVKTPFKIQGASCTLPAGTVIATFNGAGPGFAGGHSVFDSTTCAYQGAVSVSVYLNNDDSITLGSSTGFHLLTKTANASPVASPAVGGDYSIIYGTAGGVTVHVSGNVYTVSVKTPFKIQGASCTLPAGTVIATFNGAGPGFAGGHSVFDSTTCAYQGAVSVSVYLNNDDSITLGSSTGFHLLTKTANASPVASPAVGGDYSTIYGTAGGVTVHVSGNVYTVSVKTPFKIQGASCTLPAGTVIATFNGAGPGFAGGHSVFDSTTCAYQGAVSVSVYLNNDDSITLGSSTGFHLLTKL